MAKDNLTAVLYGVEDMRLVSKQMNFKILKIIFKKYKNANFKNYYLNF